MALSNRSRGDALAVCGIVGLGIAMFADVFVRPGTLATFTKSDVLEYFGPLRHYAYGELANGNFPLWNPHILAGTPCFGAFQAGLLYPFNAIYLVFPFTTAINLDLWFHVTLMGLTMYAWARHTLSPLPAFYAAVVPMLGPFFLHVMCGHLPMLACLSWTPLLFLAYDKLRDGGGFGWFLLGTLSAALQAVAGWPQGLMMVVIVFALYWVLTIWSSRHPIRVSASMAAMALFAGAMATAQLWTGMETSAESVRGGGLPYVYATGFSLPRENFLTFLAPTVFGNDHHVPYFVWNHFWESCAFIGITTLVLAIIGALCGPGKRVRVLAPILLALLVLALGGFSPVHRILYDWIPGFDQLRAMGRFTIYFSMFAALLAGEGFAVLLAGGKDYLRSIAGGLAALAVVLLVASLITILPYSALPQVNALIAIRDIVVENWPTRFPESVHQVYFAAGSLLVAAGTCVILALLFTRARKRSSVVVMIFALGIVEVSVFARIHRGTATFEQMDGPAAAAVYAGDPGEHRVLMRDEYNAPLTARGYGVWGYDALVLDRYAQFFGHTVDYSKRVVDTHLPRIRYQPLHRMVRCKYVIAPNASQKGVREVGDPMPRFLIVRDVQVMRGKKRVFAAMDDPAFDPAQTVVLEQKPMPAPEPGADGDAVRVLSGDSDHTVLEVSLDTPGILLVTDAYAKSWRARSLKADPPQAQYEVLPANYALRAVPLAAGEHRIVMEYAPPGYVHGRWISLAATTAYLLAALTWLFRFRTKRSQPGAGPD